MFASRKMKAKSSAGTRSTGRKAAVPAKAAAESSALSEWSVGLRLWIERRGEAVLGEGRADLLAEVDRTRSISAAARAIKMSYRHAWLTIQAVNEAAGEPLVESAVGGVRGGGARLTPNGRAALQLYRALSDDVRRHAAGAVARVAQRATAAVGTTLHLAAAVSLQEAVGQILTEYALLRPSVRVRTLFGGSNELAAQIAGGAVADVFLSGDAAHFLAPAKSRRFAENRVAVVALRAAEREPSTVAKLLNGEFRRLAVADPAVPLGRASQEVLARHRRRPLEPERFVQVDNSRGVPAALRSGQADLGLAFAGDAATSADLQVLAQTSGDVGLVSYHVAALSERRGADGSDESAALVDFLLSEPASRCLRRCGLRR